MSRRYWLEETPVEIRTPRNVLRWYRRADRLQVCKPDWTTADGETRPGKAVALDLAALVEADNRQALIELLEGLLADLKEAPAGRTPAA